MKIGAFQLNEPIPDLINPHAIAIVRPWVDAGNVATLALKRLETFLGAEELGRLDSPGDFFDFTRYRPVTREVDGRREIKVPNSIISYAKGDGRPDLLLCLLMEPHSHAEDYLKSFVEILDTFQVKRYCRIGGVFDAVPHTRPLRVTGTLDGEPITELEAFRSSSKNTYQGPTTILGLINEELEKLKVEIMTLMVRVPQYLQFEEDYSGAARLIEALSSFYNFPKDFPEVEMGERQYRQFDNALERNTQAREFVNRLEEYYDARASSNASSSDGSDELDQEPKLSPDVEQFLQDQSSKLDNPQG